MVPKNIHDLIFKSEYVTLHGKRDFADVIKVEDPENVEENLDYLGEPNLITQVLKSRRTEEWVREIRCEKNLTHRCQLWRQRKGITSHRWLLETRKRKRTDSPQESPERSVALLTP